MVRRLRLNKLILISIMLLATYLRLSHPELMEFKLDEAKHCKQAVELLHGRLLMISSISSLGVAKPPLMVYLMAIPFSVSRNPVFATTFIAFLNVGAVLGCYLLAREYFGERAALVAALLFAASPWAAIHSRKIFTVDLLPPFTMLLFTAIFSALIEQKHKRLILAFVWLACLIQINPVAVLFFAPLMALLLLIYRSRVKPLPLLVGILIFLLLFSPYIYYDLSHGLLNLKTLLHALKEKGTGNFSLESARYAVQLISGRGCQALAGVSSGKFTSQIVDLSWLDSCETLLFLGGLAYLSRLALRGKEAAKFSIPLLWFLVPVLFNIKPLIPLHPHYFVALYPVQFIVMGIFVDKVAGWEIPAKAFFVCLLVAIVLWQTYLFTSLLRFVDRHDTRGGFDVPAKYHLQAAEAVKRLSEGIQLMVLSEGDNPRWDGIPAIYDFLLRPEFDPHFVDHQEALVFPPKDALFLLAPGDTPAVSLLDEHAQELATESIPICGGPEAFRFYRFEASTLPELKASLMGEEMPMAFDNGVELLGYELAEEVEPGGTLRLALYWEVKERPGTSYHFFNHLVDEEGRMRGQRDGPGHPPDPWQEGEVIISWFDVPIPSEIPPGRYWVRTGMYTYPDMVRASLLDERGQPISDSLHLGPIEVGWPPVESPGEVVSPMALNLIAG